MATNGLCLPTANLKDDHGNTHLCVVLTKENASHGWAADLYNLPFGKFKTSKEYTAASELVEEVIVHFIDGCTPQQKQQLTEQLLNLISSEELAMAVCNNHFTYAIDLMKFVKNPRRATGQAMSTNPVWQAKRPTIVGNFSSTGWRENMDKNVTTGLSSDCFEKTDICAVPIANFQALKTTEGQNFVNTTDVYGRPVQISYAVVRVMHDATQANLIL